MGPINGCFSNLYAYMNVQVMGHSGVRMSPKSYFWEFLMIDSQDCYCVVDFMNASILLLSWYTIYSLLVPKIASATNLYSHKVLKTFNHNLNHKCKFTKVIENTLRIHF